MADARDSITVDGRSGEPRAARKLSLQDLVRAVEKEPTGKRVIHFHVSRLEPAAWDPRKMRQAVDFLRQAIAKLGYGDVVVAPNRDIVAWVMGLRLANVISICRKLENYFCEDREFKTNNFYGEMYFYTIVDASLELGRFRAFAVSILDFSSAAGVKPTDQAKELISVGNFSKIVELVQRSDITAHIFNQPIYDISREKAAIEFVEFFVSVKHFEDALCPQYSVAADAWLFNRLTEEFDKAVLRHIRREILHFSAKGVSLNLNLKSVMSKEFSVFAESLPVNFPEKVILEINKISMLSNWGLFEEVCGFARQRGFRICIDGFDLRDFANIRLGNIDFDFVKLKWSLGAMAEHAQVERAVRTMTEFDRSKVVLSMCDNDQAFAFAKAAGIRFVQGHLADKFKRHSMAI